MAALRVDDVLRKALADMTDAEFDRVLMRNTYFKSRMDAPFSFEFVKSAEGTPDLLFFLYRDQLQFVEIPLNVSDEPLKPTAINSMIALSEITKVSKEEELRRERQRISTDRIDKYLICRGERGKATFLIPTAHIQNIVHLSPSDANLQQKAIEDESEEREEEEPSPWKIDGTTIEISQESAILDSKLSPDGRWLSFVTKGELWLKDTLFPDLPPVQISKSPAGRVSATAEYIVQEEFDRYTGYYWDSNVSLKEDGQKIYRLVWQEYDETAVDLVSVGMDSFDETTEIERSKYPRAGKKNVETFLCVGEIVVPSDSSSFSLSSRRLKSSLKTCFPWAEYMVRFGFAHDGRVFVQMLDRLQRRIDTIHIAIEAKELISIEETEGLEPFSFSTIHSEASESWVNVGDVLHHFGDGSRRILISNESSGFRHLYVLSPSEGEEEGSQWTAKQITSGDWQIEANDAIQVDELRQVVFFMANKDSPLEKHLYCTSLSSPSPVFRLTEENCFNDVKISPNGDYFVTIFSNLSTKPQAAIFALHYGADEERSIIVCSQIVSKIEIAGWEAVPPFSFDPPKTFTIKSSSTGEDLHGCVILPQGWKKPEESMVDGDEESTGLPTIVYVYGGPHVQLVKNHFLFNVRFLRLLMYAQMGFAVLIIDNVGSSRRGLKFESWIHCRMGDYEVKDQVDLVKYAVEQGYTDPKRVLVQGTSYGGYMSLMCLAQFPDVFKVAVSEAPVTNWRGYDTGYTERYLKVPADEDDENYNADADPYHVSSVTRFASKFPSQPNRLFLIHGVMDENVHFSHTTSLIQSLIEAGVPYQLSLFPRERHGVRKNAAYNEKNFFRILKKHLL